MEVSMHIERAISYVNVKFLKFEQSWPQNDTIKRHLSSDIYA